MITGKDRETATDNQHLADTPPQQTTQLRKSTRYRFLITGLGFVLLVLLPSLDQWLDFSADFKSTENHILTPPPSFHFPHVKTYFQQFSEYYKENFGGRNALFYQYSHLKYTLFGVSPLPYKVVVGKNEWFYPGNDLNKAADQHRGLQPISLQTLRTIADKLIDKQKKMSKQGTAFYLVVAPDSYSIYPENLPDYFKPTTSNLDYLRAYLEKYTTIPFIDIRPNLLAAKSVRPTYMHTDTHWNSYGALIATLAITERMRQDFPTIPKADEKNYTIQHGQAYGGDLANMLALSQTIWDKQIYQVDPPASLLGKEVEQIPNTELGGLPSQRFVSPNTNSPNLLFVGDSFTLSLNHFVSGYFSRSYFLRSQFLADELIRSEKPDIVLLEIVERDLANLANL